MPRILVALLALFSISDGIYAEPPPVPAAAVHSALFTSVLTDNHLLRSRTLADSARSTPAALTRCKVCSVGKACGNTCISREKTCHGRQGCACDG
jgi:hypothetical protein